MTATTENPATAQETIYPAAPPRRPRRLRFGRRHLLVVPFSPHWELSAEDTARLRNAFATDIHLLASHAEIAASVEVAPSALEEIRTKKLLNNPAPTAVCLLGGNVPHLPAAFLAEAFARLEQPSIDTVVIEADNGNNCLLGFTSSMLEQLPDFVWNRPDSLQIARETAQNLGARITKLPAWYPIQTDADLQQLRRDIQRGTVTLPGTAAVLGL
jgi:hypothetical protein